MSKVKKCDHSTQERLICDILSVVFSNTELASSSLTGQTANFSRGINILAKTKLDTINVDVIEDKNKTFWVYFSQGIGLGMKEIRIVSILSNFAELST